MPDLFDADFTDGLSTWSFASANCDVMDVTAPTPQPEPAEGPKGNMAGTAVMGEVWANREITVQFHIKASSVADLIARTGQIRAILDTAREYATPYGSPVQFRWKPTGATYRVLGEVLYGDLVAVDFREGLASDLGDILRLANFNPLYELYLVCRPLLDGEQTATVTGTAYARTVGITRRYVLLSGTLGGTNLAGRVDGNLWNNTRTAFPAITPAVGDAVYLGDDDLTVGRTNELVLGVERAIQSSSAPGLILEQSTGAGTWQAVTGLVLYDDANPYGVSLQNDGLAGSLVALFATTGEKHLTFSDSAAWVAASYTPSGGSAVSARWLRIRLATAGSGVDWPDLQYTPIRSPRNLLRIPGSQVAGDAPARLTVEATNPSSGDTNRVRTLLMSAWANKKRRTRGMPAHRFGAEYCTSLSSVASIQTTDPLGQGFRGDGILQVGGSPVNWCLAFDGFSTGNVSFARTNAFPAAGQTQWCLDFWLDFKDPSGNPQDPPSAPMGVYGIWSTAAVGGKSFLLYIENKRLHLLLSRDGTKTIRFANPAGSNDALRKRFQSSVVFAAGKRYFCRVIRNKDTLTFMVGESSFKVDTFKTIGKAADTAFLGTADTYTGGSTVPRIGIPAGWDVADSEDGSKDLSVWYERIDQLRWRVGPKCVADKSFTKTQITTNDTETRGLYLFGEGTGTTVAPVAGATNPMGSGTLNGTVSWSIGAFDPSKFENQHANLILSAGLYLWPGRYRMYAVVRTRASDPSLHSIRLSQQGYFLTPYKVSPQYAGAWTLVDCGVATFVLPTGYTPVDQATSGTYVNPTNDRSNLIGVHVEGRSGVQDAFDVDEIIAVPLEAGLDGGHLVYDCGPTLGRAIQQNESFLHDGGLEPPLIGQRDAAKRWRENPDALGWPDELLAVPGRDCWLSIEPVRWYDGNTAHQLYADPAATLNVTVTVRPRFLDLSGQM